MVSMRFPFRRTAPGAEVEQARYNPQADASGAAVLYESYGMPNRELILPTLASFGVEAYGGNAVVFALVMNRMLLFSECEFKFQSLTDKRLYGTPDLELLESPWPGATTGELLARMLLDIDLAGNAFIANTGNELVRLRPDWTTIVSEVVSDDLGRASRRVVGYWFDPVGDVDLGQAFYTVDECVHWSPLPDAVSKFRGISWLIPVMRELTADRGMVEYQNSYLQHSATPNLMVRYDKLLKPETVDALQQRIAAQYGGPSNAGRTLILDAGAQADVIGANLADMSFVDVQGAGEVRLAAAAGVPPIVAGLSKGLDSATYSNYSLAMRRFADLTMRPLWRSACAALAPLVSVPAGSRLWFDVSGIAALRAGELERAQVVDAKARTAQTLIQAGFTPASIPAAVEAGDLSLLIHSGLVPTTLYQETPPAATSLNGNTSNGKLPDTHALNGATS